MAKKKNIVPDSFRRLGESPFQLPEALLPSASDNDVPITSGGNFAGGATPTAGNNIFSSNAQLPLPQSAPQTTVGAGPGGGGGNDGGSDFGDALGSIGSTGGFLGSLGPSAVLPFGSGTVLGFAGRGFGGVFGGSGPDIRGEVATPGLSIPEQLLNRISDRHFGAIGPSAFNDAGPVFNAADNEIRGVANELKTRLNRFFGDDNPLSRSLDELDAVPAGDTGVKRSQRQLDQLNGIVNAENILNQTISGIQGDPEQAALFEQSRGASIDDFATEFQRQVDIFEQGFLGEQQEMATKNMLQESPTFFGSSLDEFGFPKRFNVGRSVPNSDENDSGMRVGNFFTQSQLDDPRTVFLRNNIEAEGFQEDPDDSGRRLSNLHGFNSEEGGDSFYNLQDSSLLHTGDASNFFNRPLIDVFTQSGRSTLPPGLSGFLQTAQGNVGDLRGQFNNLGPDERSAFSQEHGVDFSDFNDNAFNNFAQLQVGGLINQSLQANRNASIFDQLSGAPQGFFDFSGSSPIINSGFGSNITPVPEESFI